MREKEQIHERHMIVCFSKYTGIYVRKIYIDNVRKGCPSIDLLNEKIN